MDHHGPWANSKSDSSNLSDASSIDSGGGGSVSPPLPSLEKLHLNGSNSPDQLTPTTSSSPSTSPLPTTTSSSETLPTTNGHHHHTNGTHHHDILQHEKPALPPRPSHLNATSSNHRRRASTSIASTVTTPIALNGSCNGSSNGGYYRLSPTSPTSPVSSEKEYTERIAKLQMDNLIPLKEDVSGKWARFKKQKKVGRDQLCPHLSLLFDDLPSDYTVCNTHYLELIKFLLVFVCARGANLI